MIGFSKHVRVGGKNRTEDTIEIGNTGRRADLKEEDNELCLLC